MDAFTPEVKARAEKLERMIEKYSKLMLSTRDKDRVQDLLFGILAEYKDVLDA